MTNQEAAKILRTENLGDSEQMELAKQMGADALENQHTHFIAPVCANCGKIIMGVTIASLGGHRNVLAISSIDPPHCPKCHMFFSRVELDYKNQNCILRGDQHNENNQN